MSKNIRQIALYSVLVGVVHYIESNGKAAIVDALRGVRPYVDPANKRGAKFK
jgi:hypothetical protein